MIKGYFPRQEFRAVFSERATRVLEQLVDFADTVSRVANSETDIAALEDGKQPLDADLTAIASLTTTAFGRGFLELADAAATRTKAGLGTIATQDADDVTISGGDIDVATVQTDAFRIDVSPTAETIVPTHTITISVNGTNYKIPIVAA